MAATYFPTVFGILHATKRKIYVSCLHWKISFKVGLARKCIVTEHQQSIEKVVCHNGVISCVVKYFYDGFVTRMTPIFIFWERGPS